jgi:mono/diheme cytochrome c family protein
VNRWKGMVLAWLLASGCSERSAPPSGAAMYQRYCASCHGSAGKGDGPVASSLQRPPADLTRIAKRAGGRFDEAVLLAIIDGRRQVATHGPREMPVWGAVFDEELEGQPYKRYTGLLQSQLLVDFLRSLQEK